MGGGRKKQRGKFIKNAASYSGIFLLSVLKMRLDKFPV
jgi:hypothetical protein